MLCKLSVTICRSNTYLMIGLSLGLCLSLLFSPENIDQPLQQQVAKQQEDRVDLRYLTMLSRSVSIGKYTPKITIKGKPHRYQNYPKTIVRPRYYSTELGIRDRVFVGVLSSNEHLHNRGVAFNKTVSHLVNKVRYFITIPEGGKPNISLPGIVGFTDTRIILKPFHIIKYITDNYLEDYDYYFVTKDSTYVNARGLLDLINKISIRRDVHLGKQLENSKEFCSLDSGILLGNALLKKMKTNLDWCVKNTFSMLDDVNFGRCIYYSTKIPCSNSIDNLEFNSFKKPPLSLVSEKNNVYIDYLKNLDKPNDVVSLCLVNDYRDFYKIHAYLTLVQLQNIDKNINMLTTEILDNSTLDTNFTIKKLMWTGENRKVKSSGRFDILRWTYFNQSHIFMLTDFENAHELIGSLKIEILRAIEAGIIEVRRKYNYHFRFNKLKNGWRIFDASRGIDYILDLNMMDSVEGTKITKRIQISKFFGKGEILSVPYVTENTRINLVLPININNVQEATGFIQKYSRICMETKDKTSLMLVFLYEMDSPSKGMGDIFFQVKRLALNLTDKYKRDQSKISWLSIRLPKNSSIFELDHNFQYVIADLTVKKFSPDSLILFTESKVSLELEYLNRVRMNTINQWQVFSPIPFVEFQPDIAYLEEMKNLELDINRSNGRYDNLNYESISFYVKDYQIVRKISQLDIPLIRSDKDIQKSYPFVKKKNGSILELFNVYSQLHLFRAVEPALKISHNKLICKGSNCEMRKLQSLGQRRQLANIVLEYQESRTYNNNIL